MGVSTVLIPWDISRWFYIIPPTRVPRSSWESGPLNGYRQALFLLDNWSVCNGLLGTWLCSVGHSWSFLLWSLIFLPLWLYSFLCAPSLLFSPVCGIWGRTRKVGYKCFQVFSVLHLNLWLLKNSRAKILTPLFSGFILITSPKAMGDSCLASWLGKETFSDKIQWSTEEENT